MYFPGNTDIITLIYCPVRLMSVMFAFKMLGVLHVSEKSLQILYQGHANTVVMQ